MLHELLFLGISCGIVICGIMCFIRHEFNTCEDRNLKLCNCLSCLC